jgi:serine/threonine protein kinase
MSRPQGRIGAYDLIERVGEGGMAEVWLARREGLGGAVKSCALKLMLPRIAGNDRHRKMFLQEARLALKLNHANIVSVFDAGEEGGRLYMALDWVDGVNLRDFSQRIWDIPMRFSIPVVCHVVGELLNALRYAHTYGIGGQSLGIIHRDVSPHNVLISSSGEVKLADFGIARVIGEDTSQMHVKGKLRYMPPEQFVGEAVQASDLFAVGAILHELLAGRRFREGIESQEHWIRVLMTEDAVPPLGRDGVPPELEALRQGLLAAKVADRIQSADEALMHLSQCGQWRNSTIELRKMYERYFNLNRRTGLTRGDGALPALPDVPRPPTSPSSPPPPVADRLPSGLEAVPPSNAEPDAPVFFRRKRKSSGQQAAVDVTSTRAEEPSFAHADTAAGGRPPSEPVRTRAASAPSLSPPVAPTALLASPFESAQPGESAPSPTIAFDSGPAMSASRPHDTPSRLRHPDTDVAGPSATRPASASAFDATRTAFTTQKARDRRVKIIALVAVASALGTGGFVAVLKLREPAPASEAAATQPVQVELKAESGGEVHVKVDNRELFVAPQLATKFESGRHGVAWRASLDDAWQEAGEIELQPGRTYALTIGPSGVDVKERQ